jgi:hypothetical protein
VSKAMDQQTIHSGRLGSGGIKDVQAVALSNFDEGGPAAVFEEGAELKMWISVCVTSKETTYKGK